VLDRPEIPPFGSLRHQRNVAVQHRVSYCLHIG
jgi:hypothetical protein